MFNTKDSYVIKATGKKADVALVLQDAKKMTSEQFDKIYAIFDSPTNLDEVKKYLADNDAKAATPATPAPKTSTKKSKTSTKKSTTAAEVTMSKKEFEDAIAKAKAEGKREAEAAAKEENDGLKAELKKFKPADPDPSDKSIRKTMLVTLHLVEKTKTPLGDDAVIPVMENDAIPLFLKKPASLATIVTTPEGDPVFVRNDDPARALIVDSAKVFLDENTTKLCGTPFWKV